MYLRQEFTEIFPLLNKKSFETLDNQIYYYLKNYIEKHISY